MVDWRRWLGNAGGHKPATIAPHAEVQAPPRRRAAALLEGIEVRRSEVHGQGVFALRGWRAREEIGLYAGRRHPPDETHPNWDDRLTYLFGLSDGSVIDGAQGGNGVVQKQPFLGYTVEQKPPAQAPLDRLRSNCGFGGLGSVAFPPHNGSAEGVREHSSLTERTAAVQASHARAERTNTTRFEWWISRAVWPTGDDL